MSLQLEDLALVCAGCRERETVKLATKLGWNECTTCHHHLCPECIKDWMQEGEGLCPGGHSLNKPHKMDLFPIDPTEIQQFTLKASRSSDQVIFDEHSLTARILYEPINPHHRYGHLSIERQLEQLIKDNLTPKEETWKRYGLVLVKRYRGKFTSWEKVQ